MFDLLFITSIVGSTAQAIKEACTPTIPVENWANKELHHKDMMDGVSIEQRMKNAKNGKYKVASVYSEPHRDPANGKIIIENNVLYHEDIKNYGAYQAQQWVKQGKYNLSQKELEKERNRIEKHYERLFGLL